VRRSGTEKAVNPHCASTRAPRRAPASSARGRQAEGREWHPTYECGIAQRAAIDRQDQALDFKPVVKLFTPDAQCTWLLTEIDEGTDLAFGLCDLGMGEPELGYVSLTELRTVRGKLGLPIERDLHFEADKPISAYTDEARTLGRIVT
jgi:hypothetical protein